MPGTGKQAGIEPTLGRQSGSRTVAAKWLADRRDDADFATPVAVTPALSHFARIVCIDRFQWVDRSDAFEDFSGRQDLVEAPAIGGPDIHIFDESQDMPGTPKVVRHWQNVVVIDTPADHHIDLDRTQSGAVGSFNPRQYIGHRKVDIVHAAKGLIVQGVQTDRDPLQSRSCQGTGLSDQQGGIGCECQFNRFAVDRSQG